MHGYENSVPGAVSSAHILSCFHPAFIYKRACVYVHMYIYADSSFYCPNTHINTHTFGLVMRQTTKKRNHTLCEHLYGKRLRNLILPKHSSFILVLNADLLGSK